jgi:hypothetical protein
MQAVYEMEYKKMRRKSKFSNAFWSLPLQAAHFDSFYERGGGGVSWAIEKIR